MQSYRGFYGFFHSGTGRNGDRRQRRNRGDLEARGRAVDVGLRFLPDESTHLAAECASGEVALLEVNPAPAARHPRLVRGDGERREGKRQIGRGPASRLASERVLRDRDGDAE